MSSILTRTAQMVHSTQIREAIDGQTITRDPQIEALYKEANEIEQVIQQLVNYCEYLYKTLPALEYFSQGMSSVLPKLYDSHTFLRESTLQISEVHQTNVNIFKEAEQDCKIILEHIKKLLHIFSQVRFLNSQRNKSRLIYDHYVHKLESLRNSLTKKKSKSQFYNETPKEAERLARQSEVNLKTDSSKLLSALKTATNLKYTHIVPVIARISKLELKMFGKLSDSINSIKYVPDSILKEVKEYNTDNTQTELDIYHHHWEDKENIDQTNHENLRSMAEEDLTSKFRKPKIEREHSFDCIQKRSYLQSNSQIIQKEENEAKQQRLFGQDLPNTVEISHTDSLNTQNYTSDAGNFKISYSKNPSDLEDTKFLRYPSLPIPSEFQSSPAHYIATAPSQTPDFNSPFTTAKPLTSSPTALQPTAPLLPQETTQRLLFYKNSNLLQELKNRLIPPQPLQKTPSESYDPFEGLEKIQATSIISQTNTETSKPTPKKHNPFIHILK